MTRLVSKSLPLLVSVAALGCHCHCVATAAEVRVQGLVDWRHVPPDGEAPVDPSPHADHDESGCICRGAVFVPALDIAQLHARQMPVLADALLPAPLSSDLRLAAENPLTCMPADDPPRVSGRMLRALISSLLI